MNWHALVVLGCLGAACAFPPARRECVAEVQPHCTLDGWCDWLLFNDEDLGWPAQGGPAHEHPGFMLRSLHGFSTSNVWVGVVGNNASRVNPGITPVAWHWDGCGWTRVELADVSLHDVTIWAAPQDTAWIAALGQSDLTLLRWNGLALTQLETWPNVADQTVGDPQFRTNTRLQWVADNDVWVAAGWSLRRFTGLRWVPQPIFSPAFWSDSRETISFAQDSLVRSGAEVGVVIPFLEGEVPVASWGTAARDVWWVTREGSAAHSNATTVDRSFKLAESLSMVHGRSNDDVTFCSAARCFHWNGTWVREIRVPRNTLLTGLWTAPNGRLWLATRDGRVMVEQW